MKKILKGIQEAFNNIYVKVLYLTILIMLAIFGLIVLFYNYPILIVILSIIIFAAFIYTLILDLLGLI